MYSKKYSYYSYHTIHSYSYDYQPTYFLYFVAKKKEKVTWLYKYTNTNFFLKEDVVEWVPLMPKPSAKYVPRCPNSQFYDAKQKQKFIKIWNFNLNLSVSLTKIEKI